MPQLKQSFRWFGEKDDPIPLKYIQQIPAVETVVGALYDVPVGEVWPEDEIAELKKQVTDAGLNLDVIESVNIHDDIKVGLPTRDRYIENYQETIRRLGNVGVKVICYNFMPVFDWLRTNLNYQLPDGSYVLQYDDALATSQSPEELSKTVAANSGGFTLPGWEPERLADLKELFAKYEGIDNGTLRENLKYFLERIVPVCEEVGIKMAIHPDDPPKKLYGLPRIVKNFDDLKWLTEAVDSPSNGLTVCSGSLGENPENDVPAIMRYFQTKDRIPFVHLRNIKWTSGGSFHESSHLSRLGSLDMYEIVRALYETGFEGYARPDHGRMIWGETGRPGYGLYDRALGTAYINGLWEAVEKGASRSDVESGAAGL